MLSRIASVLSIVALLSFAHMAVAQAPSGWPESWPNPHSTRADVVLLSQPTVRHKCRVHEITASQIVCGVGIGRRPIAYPAADVAAIIETHKDPTAKVVTIVLIVAGACLASSFFVPVTAIAITLRVLAGLSLPVIGAFEIGDNPEPYKDVLIYQRSNTTLAVHLR